MLATIRLELMALMVLQEHIDQAMVDRAVMVETGALLVQQDRKVVLVFT